VNDLTLYIKDRLISIDALRGFAMFLILAYDIGRAPVLQTFIKLWGESIANAASVQLEYHFTEGLRLSFIAMPMFLCSSDMRNICVIAGRFLFDY
jgi:uncharacterized membrane protein